MKFKSSVFVPLFLLFTMIRNTPLVPSPLSTPSQIETTDEKVQQILADEIPVERNLEAKNTNINLKEFNELRLRHDPRLLKFARVNQDLKSPNNLPGSPAKTSRKLDGAVEDPDLYFGEGSELFLAQEQKRLLLLQFYEVILNNKSRNPQVDSRVIKLMTNYLQTLEYIYVKQVQHQEESPPVLYDYQTDSENATFCDSPSVSLPDEKFLDEDEDYFVKLFDQYNSQKLGVLKSVAQVKENGLFRKLDLHMKMAQNEEKSFSHRDEERRLGLKSKKKRHSVSLEQTGTEMLGLSRTLQHSMNTRPNQRHVRRPLKFNAGNDDPAPIFDPFPIENAHTYRENIHEDLIEILQFYISQFDLIFRRMEELNNLNRGLKTWEVQPNWRDYEQAVLFMQALSSPNNRFLDAMDLIASGLGNKRGPSLMGHLFHQWDRIVGLNRRCLRIEQGLSLAKMNTLEDPHPQLNNQMDIVRHYRRRLQSLTQEFNTEGDAVANDSRSVRRVYVRLEMLGRFLIESTRVDMVDRRHQTLNMRRFVELIPKMVTFKLQLNSQLRRLVNRMNDMHHSRRQLTDLLNEFESRINSRRMRKLIRINGVKRTEKIKHQKIGKIKVKKTETIKGTI